MTNPQTSTPDAADAAAVEDRTNPDDGAARVRAQVGIYHLTVRAAMEKALRSDTGRASVAFLARLPDDLARSLVEAMLERAYGPAGDKAASRFLAQLRRDNRPPPPDSPEPGLEGCVLLALDELEDNYRATLRVLGEVREAHRLLATAQQRARDGRLGEAPTSPLRGELVRVDAARRRVDRLKVDSRFFDDDETQPVSGGAR